MNQIVLTAFRIMAGLTLASTLLGADPTLYEINGTTLAVTVEPERPAITLGERSWLVFRIENRGMVPFTFTPLRTERSGATSPAGASLIQVESTEGKEIGEPIRSGFFASSGPGPRPITIPPGGTSEYRYYLPVWAEFEQPGMYRIHVWRRLTLGTDETRGNGEQRIFEARTELRVEPANPARMGEIIAELGEKMLRGVDYEATSTALYQIPDERVIPHLRRLIYDPPGVNGPVIQAFYALAKFSNDEVLTILKYGLDFKVADLPQQMQSQRNLGENIAESVRSAAANALLQSRHPQAFALLASRRRDPSSSIRNIVVIAAYRQSPAIGVPVLRDLADDPERAVGPEARRLIEVMTAPGYMSEDEAKRLPAIRRQGNELIVRYDARPADLARFKDEKGITALKFTREGAGPLTYLTERDLAVIAGWTDLVTLDFGPISFTDAVLPHLARLPKLEFSLPDPYFFGPWLSDAGFAAVAKLPGLLDANLRGLGETAVAKFSGTTQLRSLTLPTGATDASLALFKDNTRLNRLDLQMSSATDAGMATVAGFPNLQTLVLWNLPITDAGIARLAGLTQLRVLAFGGLTDAGLAILAQPGNLEDLQLGRSPLTDASLPSLARLSRLKTLSVPGSRLTRIPDNLPELTSFNLNDSGVSDAGVLGLADHPKLTSIELANTRITDAALGRIAELKDLTRLDLNGTGITDAAMDQLALLPKLENLGLRGTRVTAAGLAKLAGSKSLRTLDQSAVPNAATTIPSLQR